MKILQTLTLIILFIPTLAFASIEPIFETIYSEALKSATTPDGAKYNRDLGNFFMDNFQPKMTNCMKNHKQSALVPFRAVFKVDSSGLITDFITDIDNDFSRCFKSFTKGIKGPNPPNGITLNPFEWEGVE